MLQGRHIIQSVSVVPVSAIETTTSDTITPITSLNYPDKGKQNTTLTPILIRPVFDKTIFETRTTLNARDDARNVTEQQTMSSSGTSTIFGKEKNDTGIENNLETNNVHSIFSSATAQPVATQNTLAPMDSISLSSVFEKPTTPLVVPEEQLTMSTDTRMPILIKPVFDQDLFDMVTTSNPRNPFETETTTLHENVTMVSSLEDNSWSEGEAGDVLENFTKEFIDMVSQTQSSD